MRISSGVEGFDGLIDGGFPSGRLYVVSGPPGSGKTTFSAQFAAAGATHGGKCLYVSMHESREDIVRDMSEYDFGFEEAVKGNSITFVDAFSGEGRRFFGIQGDRHERSGAANRLASLVEARDIDRVVFDSTMLMRYLLDDEEDTLIQFLTTLKRTNATTLLVSEMTDPTTYSDEHYLAHGVVFFHNYLEDDRMKRGVQVVKMRGAKIDNRIHNLSFTDDGLRVGAGWTISH